MFCRVVLFRHCGFLSIACCAVLTWPSVGNLPADERDNSKNTQPTPTSDIFLPAPRELNQHLNRAKRSLDEGHYSDAVSRLGSLLNDPGAEDYFIPDSHQAGRMVSLKAEAQRILGTMPADGRAAYELQFGSEAQRLLEIAVSESDIGKLIDVSRKYFQTEAGQQATYLVGRYHLDTGRPLAAALTLQRLTNNGNTTEAFEPELSLCLALSWFYAGMESKGRQVLETLQKDSSGLNSRDTAAPASLLADVGTAVDWLLEQITTKHGPWGSREDQWLLHRGNASRTGEMRGDMPLVVSENPLVNCRWRVPASNHHRMESKIGKIQQHYIANQIPALPSLHPLAVNDVILMRTPRYLFAVDSMTGKRTWLYDDLSLQLTEGFADETNSQILSNRSDVLSGWYQRIWDDAPYGQMSSDGERVYLINKLGYPTNRRMLVGRNGINFPNPLGLKSYNELVALELRSQGKRQWIIGGESGNDDSALSGAFFLGAPLPIDGQLYVLAEISGEIHLLILDAVTGNLVWRQPLIHTEETSGTIIRNSLRRVAGATPSLGDGILVCPTTAGAVVAVDVATRSLLWGFEYETVGGNKRENAWGLARRHITRGQPGNRWNDATVTIAGGKVLITPVESNFLYCLQLFDGQLLWKQPRKQNLYLACVYDSVALLVGHHTVQALQLDNGQSAWPADLKLPNDAMPSGRGFLSGSHYYLPTTMRELVKIDLATGRLDGSQPTQQVLGNLICYDDCVISQRVDSLTSFYQVGALRQKVGENMASGKEDAWTLAHHAQLMLHDNQRTLALQSLRRAYQMESKDEPTDVTRALLVDTLLRGLREDFVHNEWLSTEVAELIDQPAQRMEYLRLMTIGLQKVDKFDQAFEACVDLIDAHSDETMEVVSEDLNIRRDRWIQVQLANIYSGADRTQRTGIDQVIKARFLAATAGDRTEALRKFHQHFGFHTIDRQAQLELARRLMATSHRLEAEVLFIDLMKRSTGKAAGTATGLLANLYDTLGLPQQASQMYKVLHKRWTEVPILNGKTGREVWEESLASLSNTEKELPHTTWPRGRVTIGVAAKRDVRQFPVGYRNHPVTPVHAQGPGLNRVKISLHAQQLLLGSDSLGRQLFRIPVLGSEERVNRLTKSNLTEAKTYGHLLLASHGLSLLAIDTLPGATDSTDRVLWRNALVPMATQKTAIKQINQNTTANIWGEKTRKTTARTSTDEVRIGRIGPLHPHGVCYQRGESLICVDPLQVNDNPIWVRTDVASGSALFGDHELLFVAPPDTTEAMVLRQIDGSFVGPRLIPPAKNRWVTIGRNILAWKQTGQQLALTFYDPWYEEEIWTYPFPVNSKGCLVEHDQVAILSPQGRFVLISLEDGTILIDQLLEPEPNLDSIHVLRFSGQTILATTTAPFDDRDKSIRIAAAPSPSYVPLIHGRIYAFDPQTGERQWKIPAVIEQYGLPLDQPFQSPVLIFLRHEPVSKSEPRAVKTTVLCLDRRDGSILLDNTNATSDSLTYVGSQSGTYEVTVDPSARQVVLKLFEKTLTMTFTDAPVPPEPPAQTGTAASIGTKRKSSVQRMIDATKRSIENLTAPAPK